MERHREDVVQPVWSVFPAVLLLTLWHWLCCYETFWTAWKGSWWETPHPYVASLERFYHNPAYMYGNDLTVGEDVCQNASRNTHMENGPKAKTIGLEQAWWVHFVGWSRWGQGQCRQVRLDWTSSNHSQVVKSEGRPQWFSLQKERLCTAETF